MDVDVNPDLPPEIYSEYRSIFEEFKSAFAPHTGEPPLLKIDRPYHIKLKPGARPRFCPKPKWSPEQAEFWLRWAQASLAGGGWTHSHGLWCSRGVGVFKQGPEGKLDPNYDVRPCGAYVEVNDECEREPPSASCSMEELRQQLGDSISFFGTDVYNAYRQIELDEESKDLTAVWTPLGPIRSERLVFGLMNAGTVLGRYLSAVFAGLSSAARRRWLNYADDFLSGQTSHTLMFGWLREFLPLCIVNKVALKAPKTRAGYPTAKFVGHLLGHGKEVPAAHCAAYAPDR
jgi:hypothetical protein